MLPKEETIRGRKAGSSYEVNFAKSLDKFGWDYLYQLPMFGGTQVVGGTVVDFLVITVPRPTPVYIHGEYWHQGQRSQRDRVMEALIDAKMRRYYNPIKVIWGEKVQTPEQSDATVLAEFGRRQ